MLYYFTFSITDWLIIDNQGTGNDCEDGSLFSDFSLSQGKNWFFLFL